MPVEASARLGVKVLASSATVSVCSNLQISAFTVARFDGVRVSAGAITAQKIVILPCVR